MNFFRLITDSQKTHFLLTYETEKKASPVHTVPGTGVPHIGMPFFLLPKA